MAEEKNEFEVLEANILIQFQETGPFELKVCRLNESHIEIGSRTIQIDADTVFEKLGYENGYHRFKLVQHSQKEDQLIILFAFESENEFEEWKWTVSFCVHRRKVQLLGEKLDKVERLEKVLTDWKRVNPLEMMEQSSTKRKAAAEQAIKKMQSEGVPSTDPKMVLEKKRIKEAEVIIESTSQKLALIRDYSDARIETEWEQIFNNSFNSQRNRLAKLRELKVELKIQLCLMKQEDDELLTTPIDTNRKNVPIAVGKHNATSFFGMDSFDNSSTAEYASVSDVPY